MLKFIITSLLLILTSINLFPQRLCEESINTVGLHKAATPDEIIIIGNNSLYWYDVNSCEVIDEFNPGIGNTGFRISMDARYCILISFNPNLPVEFVKYDLTTKEKVEDFSISSKSEHGRDLEINDFTNSFYILSDSDNKITEYNLESGEEIRSVSTPSSGLSEIKVSPNGNLIGVYSPWKDFGNILHIYNAHTLEFIRSINFRDYFEEGDFNTSSGFDFNPINNDVLISSEKEILNINPITGESRIIIDNSYISMKEVDTTPDNNLVIAGIGSKWNIGVFNSEDKNDYYTLNEVTQYIVVIDQFIIGANQNPSKNIFKLALTTDIEEVSEPVLNVFPNPNSGIITIEITKNYPSQIEIKLYDMQGSLILDLLNEFISENHYVSDFSLENLPNGSYLLEIKVGENEYVENIILEK